jgi:hypothetical protein
MPVGVGRYVHWKQQSQPGHILLLHSVYSTVHLIKSQSSSPYFCLQKTKEQKLEARNGFSGGVFQFHYHTGNPVCRYCLFNI